LLEVARNHSRTTSIDRDNLLSYGPLLAPH